MNATVKRLLWIDDEIEFLRSHILFLEEHGYIVEKASNGDDALVMVKSQTYDLILLDEQMPGKDGLTTLEEIKAFDNALPVVMVTKSEEERLMEAALGRNISGYLIKPVNPSQVLSICKTVLHSRAIRSNHVTSSYIREMSEIKSNLLANQTPAKWEKVHYQLSKWDVELHALGDPGLEETHRTHRKEVAKRFSQFVEENYLSWFGRKGGNQNLLTQTIKRKVVPLLAKGDRCTLVVMAGMRMDQWLAIQPQIETLFRIENAMAWAMLPTEKVICRTALFSGLTPREVAQKQPQLFEKMSEAEDKSPYERELIRYNLRVQGIDIEDPRILSLRNHSDSENLLLELETQDDARLQVVVVEFVEMLNNLRRENPLMIELAPDERGVREMTTSWFKGSNLFEALQKLAQKGRTVVITSDHGAIRVEQAAEVFCQEEKTPHPRVKVGQNLSCDERHALFIEAPVQYGLPGEVGETAYLIAKDTFYFVYPNKFQYFVTQFKGQLVSGGLSMEEMLVPVATLTPR